MEKRHTRCLTLCSESNKHPLDLCLGQKCMQIWKQKTGRNDFKQRECLHLEFYRRWDIQWFYRSHPQIKARLSLSLPFYQRSPFFCIRRIPPPDPLLPTIPQAKQKRQEKTGYSCGIMVTMLFPQDPYMMEAPPRTRVRGLQPNISYSVAIFTQVWNNVNAFNTFGPDGTKNNCNSACLWLWSTNLSDKPQ